MLNKRKSLLAPFHSDPCPGHHSNLNFVATEIFETKHFASNWLLFEGGFVLRGGVLWNGLKI